VTLEPLYTATEMRAAEERYPGFPATAPELMERAGRAVADEVLLAYPTAHRIAVVCGGGSNGGDGRIAARILREAGRDAVVTDDPAAADLVVDALFGTGFSGPPRAGAAETIARINAAGCPVVSVDLPSGVDASTGEVAGAVVQADLTVTCHGGKVGLAVAPGRFHVGRVIVADIGLEHASTAARLGDASLLEAVPLRGVRDSKYTAGQVVVVGGSEGMTGAAVLTARAVLRGDAGYVTLCVPRSCLSVAEVLALEPVTVGFDPGEALAVVRKAAAGAGAIAIGPGLGRSPEARELVRAVLAAVDLPVVVDADALFDFDTVSRTAPTVLTPHAGELARLLGQERSWVDAHRLAAARLGAERFGAVVLLKGPDTIVADPAGNVVVCDAGPPALATAGTGDVLTGVVAAFLAKGLGPVDAAAAAAIAHGLAARAVAHQAGLIASDVVEALPRVLSRSAI
jgi:ADP-dependent NAD(P)H-hydrate dehydratase / NAD(P)H-hydrate epimerase